jgi:predicted nucleic acid-binding protein
LAIATSVIVAGELNFMVQNSQQQAANFIKIQAFLQRLEIYVTLQSSNDMIRDSLDLAIATKPAILPQSVTPSGIQPI